MNVSMRCASCGGTHFEMGVDAPEPAPVVATQADDGRMAYSVAEVARFLDLSEGKVRDLIARTDEYRLPSLNPGGGKVLIPKHLLLKWMERHAVKAFMNYVKSA